MLSSSQLESILQFDTCTIANAIEHFKVRLRNEGFTHPGLRCVTKGATRLLGYAATSKVRSSNPPMTGTACGYATFPNRCLGQSGGSASRQDMRTVILWPADNARSPDAPLCAVSGSLTLIT